MTTTTAKDGAFNVPRYVSSHTGWLVRDEEHLYLGIPGVETTIVADNHACLDRIETLEAAIRFALQNIKDHSGGQPVHMIGRTGIGILDAALRPARERTTP